MAFNTNRQLVIITNVCPQIKDGAYAAKTAVGEELIISADIFTHGHEALSAAVFIKHASEKKWQEFPLSFIKNDRWEFKFSSGQTGIYQFKLQAWLNPFVSWQKGFVKKFKAGQDVAVELQAGAAIIE